jgi:group II intron reverse transcriptase/maturase
MTERLDRVRRVAKGDKEVRFTTLLHHVDIDRLREAYRRCNPKAAVGVDGVTWEAYGRDLEANLEDLHERLHRGAYRVKPTRRVYIPKADGRQRPLGIVTLEDKIVQLAFVEVLNAIYEADFYGFSYGFRPGRSQHKALDALAVGIERRKVNWVLDADLANFFTSLDQGELMELVERRIADKRILKLLRLWLEAGAVEDGHWSASEEGTPQGAPVSPLLANVYLHYVIDQWAERWRRSHARGDVVLVRYADDFIVGFQYREEAERFREALVEQLAAHGLELNAEKTRLIEFGRYAAPSREARGESKPETFDFLGFTHISGKTRSGGFALKRISMKKRMRAKLKQVKEQLVRRMHQPIPEVGRWLGSVVQGHLNYFAVHGNQEAEVGFRNGVIRLWRWALGRRSQKGRVTWKRMFQLAKRWLPPVRVCHPYPNQRFDAR